MTMSDTAALAQNAHDALVALGAPFVTRLGDIAEHNGVTQRSVVSHVRTDEEFVSRMFTDDQQPIIGLHCLELLGRVDFDEFETMLESALDETDMNPDLMVCAFHTAADAGVHPLITGYATIAREALASLDDYHQPC